MLPPDRERRRPRAVSSDSEDDDYCSTPIASRRSSRLFERDAGVRAASAPWTRSTQRLIDGLHTSHAYPSQDRDSDTEIETPAYSPEPYVTVSKRPKPAASPVKTSNSTQISSTKTMIAPATTSLKLRGGAGQVQESSIIKVTVCFLRNTNDALIHPANYTTGDEERILDLGAEHLLTRLASPQPGQIQVRNMNIVEDSLFEIKLPADTATSKDLLLQIYRLLNVYFGHSRPEVLDLHVKIYDEAAGSGRPRNLKLAGQPQELTSVLYKGSPRPGYCAGEVLAIIDRITYVPEAICSAQSWQYLPKPAEWITCVLKSNDYKKVPGDFFRRILGSKSKRVNYDIFPTAILPQLSTGAGQNPYAALHGVGLHDGKDEIEHESYEDVGEADVHFFGELAARRATW